MRLMKVGWLLVVALLLSTGWASAQSTTGTIRGHLSDSQGLNLPGVVVSVTSANLQGTRVAITSENGDYILTLLPSGIYTVTFEISGFERAQRIISVAPTQNVPLTVVLGPSTIVEEIQVVGRAADVLTNTAQVATNFTQDFISRLANNRDLSTTLLLAPSVHPTGPGGAYSISGSMSFENLFLVNGVTVNENLRGQAENLYVEDAIQETTIATAGVSAEYGRFGGGVVNVVTKSGGNTFAGSYRDTLNNDNWRALVPKQTGDTFAADTKLDDVVPTHEYTLGGPVVDALGAAGLWRRRTPASPPAFATVPRRDAGEPPSRSRDGASDDRGSHGRRLCATRRSRQQPMASVRGHRRRNRRW